MAGDEKWPWEVCGYHSEHKKMFEVLDNKIIEEEKKNVIRFKALEQSVEKDKLHLIALIGHVEEMAEQHQNSSKEAIEKSDANIESHFRSVNEFNERMKVVVNEQASKEWAEGFEKAVNARLGKLENYESGHTGSSKWSDHIITVLIALMVTIVARYVFKF